MHFACSRKSKEVAMAAGLGQGEDEMGVGAGAQHTGDFKPKCDVVPLAFAKFPVAAVGQKFCQGQRWRQQRGKAVGKLEREPAEVVSHPKLGWGRLGLSCLWTSDGIWSLD